MVIQKNVSKSERTGLRCPGGRIDSSIGISLFETLADSFHGLTKYSFDKNKFPIEAKLQFPLATKFRARELKTVYHTTGEPQLRMNYFTTPVFELSGSGY